MLKKWLNVLTEKRYGALRLKFLLKNFLRAMRGIVNAHASHA